MGRGSGVSGGRGEKQLSPYSAVQTVVFCPLLLKPINLFNSILAATHVPYYPLQCAGSLNERHMHIDFIFLYTLNSAMAGPPPNLHMTNLLPSYMSAMLSVPHFLRCASPLLHLLLPWWIFLFLPPSLVSCPGILKAPLLSALPSHCLPACLFTS